jgi:cell shape-determining protein MreD
MYLIVATNPLRYRALIWVAVAEQAIGITYALASAIGSHTLTLSQFATQAVINIVIAAMFILLRPSETATTRRAGATA